MKRKPKNKKTLELTLPKKIWGRTPRNPCKTGLSRSLSPNFPIEDWDWLMQW